MDQDRWVNPLRARILDYCEPSTFVGAFTHFREVQTQIEGLLQATSDLSFHEWSGAPGFNAAKTGCSAFPWLLANPEQLPEKLAKADALLRSNKRGPEETSKEVVEESDSDSADGKSKSKKKKTPFSRKSIPEVEEVEVDEVRDLRREQEQAREYLAEFDRYWKNERKEGRLAPFT